MNDAFDTNAYISSQIHTNGAANRMNYSANINHIREQYNTGEYRGAFPQHNNMYKGHNFNQNTHCNFNHHILYQPPIKNEEHVQYLNHTTQLPQYTPNNQPPPPPTSNFPPPPQNMRVTFQQDYSNHKYTNQFQQQNNHNYPPPPTYPSNQQFQQHNHPPPPQYTYNNQSQGLDTANYPQPPPPISTFTPHYCHQCKRKFYSADDLDIHYAEDHVQCDYCSFHGREEIVEAHLLSNHREIDSIDSEDEEDLNLWIESRRRKFPKKIKNNDLPNIPMSKLEKRIRKSLRRSRPFSENPLVTGPVVVCEFFSKGNCRRGDKCLNKHVKHQSKCASFSANGSCRYGSNCRFLHGRGDSPKNDNLGRLTDDSLYIALSREDEMDEVKKGLQIVKFLIEESELFQRS